MPYYVRKILEPKKWLSCECLDHGQIPSDPLKDLATKNCNLSVFKINDDESNLDDVLVELALMNGKEADRLDFMKFSESDFGSLQVRQTPPTLAIIPTNAGFHYDLGAFNSQRIVDFLNAIWPSVEERSNFRFKGDVQALIKKALGEGKITTTKLSEKQKASIYF